MVWDTKKDRGVDEAQDLKKERKKEGGGGGGGGKKRERKRKESDNDAHNRTCTHINTRRRTER